MAKIAGADSEMSFHSISVIFLINKTETKSKAAPSICLGKLVASGAKNIHAKTIYLSQGKSFQFYHQLLHQHQTLHN